METQCGLGVACSRRFIQAAQGKPQRRTIDVLPLVAKNTQERALEQHAESVRVSYELIKSGLKLDQAQLCSRPVVQLPVVFAAILASTGLLIISTGTSR